MANQLLNLKIEYSGDENRFERQQNRVKKANETHTRQREGQEGNTLKLCPHQQSWPIKYSNKLD